MYCNRRIRILCARAAGAAAGLLPVYIFAGVVTHRLGEQDFAAGAGPLLVDQTRQAGVNEAFPFDGTVFGDDRSRKFGRFSFHYDFAASATVTSGMLTLGIIGLDSPPEAPASVKLFLDGIEQPNDVFAGASSALFRSSQSVVSVPVPTQFLNDGVLDVTIKAFRRSPGYPGNAIEPDFSTLALTDPALPDENTAGNHGQPGDPQGNGGNGNGGNNGGGNGNGGGGSHQPPAAVPLPPAAWSGICGLAMAGWFRHRKKKAD